MQSGRKGSSNEADVVLSESHSDEEAVKTKSDADGEDGAKHGQNTNLQRLPSDSDNEESVNEANEVQEDNAEKKGHDDAEQHEVASGDTCDVDKGSTDDSECVSSVTDLEKLKNLLKEVAQPETPKAETTQVDDSNHGQEPSTVAVTDESDNFESYFQELEDDMFGWESDEADHNASDNETGDAEDCRGTTIAKSPPESKGESDANIKASGTEVVEDSTYANDVAMSSQLDSLQGEDTHSLDNTHEPSTTDSSIKVGAESQQINDTEEMSSSRHDGNVLEANESDSSPDEKRTDEQRTSGNTNDEDEEAQQTKDLETRETPEEQTFDEANCGDQGNAQIPKLPLFSGADGSNKKEQDGGITVPPTDEVRKQLKDVLVDVRFFLGMYIW